MEKEKRKEPGTNKELVPFPNGLDSFEPGATSDCDSRLKANRKGG